MADWKVPKWVIDGLINSEIEAPFKLTEAQLRTLRRSLGIKTTEMVEEAILDMLELDMIRQELEIVQLLRENTYDEWARENSSLLAQDEWTVER